jgi:putative MATE family efflux protein
MCGYNLIGALQRGLGDSKTPMKLIIIAGICNIILNYIFVGIIGIGVIGAALATVISQGLSLVLGIIYFRINKHIISFKIKEIKIYPEFLKELIKIGLPNAAQSLISNIAFITFTGLANGFGMAASAAFGIGMKIDTFAWMPSEAIGSSVAAFTSQNIGAGKPKRAIEGLKEASKIAVGISVLTVFIVYIFAPNLIKIFNTDIEVISYGTEYLRTGCFGYLISTLIHPCIGFIRGTGNSIKTIINVIISQYLLRIPFAYILANYIGFAALPYATMAGTIFSALFYIIFIKSGKWTRSSGYREMRNISNKKNSDPIKNLLTR